MEYRVEVITPVGYELTIGEFRGPLDKLLELIDERKLEITRLNLAQVTADFVAYLETLEEIDHKELANFVVVASKLVLIKSYALLPNLELSGEEERDMAELEKRLRLYKEFRQAERNIAGTWDNRRMTARPYLASVPTGFYLTERVRPEQLRKDFEQLVEMVTELRKLETREMAVVNLEEKIAELLQRVKTIVRTSFSHLRGGKEKSEVVVMFLALLHLLKDNRISVMQEEIFGDITILNIDGKT
ncbi:MAG: ScpA family protein [Candidatus Colwellbacteria bacterium]|nr:ScpA family protein [Candidatus Colwellbacteria bacterium]